MNESEIMETYSITVDSCSKAGTGGSVMSSALVAQNRSRSIADLLAPNQPAKVKIDKLYRELSKLLPAVTSRRARAFFFGEAARVDWEEMQALDELLALEETRRENREFAATTNRLAALLAAEGASFTREQLAVLARVQSRSSDLSRPLDARPGIARRIVAVSGRRAA